jgi:hypothetical protein
VSCLGFPAFQSQGRSRWGRRAHGALLMAVLAGYPHLRGILVERDHLELVCSQADGDPLTR